MTARLDRTADRTGTVVPLVGLTAAVVGLHLLGRGELAAPPIGSLAHLEQWLATRSPVGATLAVVRLGALAVGYHLLVALALATAARRRGRTALARLAARTTLPAFRHLVGAVAGVGLTAATAAPAGPALAAAVAQQRLPAEPAPASTSTATLARLPGGAVALDHLGSEATGPTGRATLVHVAPAPAGATAADPVAPEPAPAGRVHVVRPGDHLWALAEAELASVAGGTPAADAVDDYWMRVVRANPQVVDPDLLFPGDEVVLPPIPGR